MFIKTTKYTINSDNISYAQHFANGTVGIYFLNETRYVELEPGEAEEFFRMVDRRTLPSVFAAESAKPSEDA